jgi:hypothetical protein
MLCAEQVMQTAYNRSGDTASDPVSADLVSPRAADSEAVASGLSQVFAEHGKSTVSVLLEETTVSKFAGA